MKSYPIVLALMMLCSSYILTLNPKMVSGTVTAADDGKPIPGVNILIKGTTIITVTDIDGKYSIKAPSDNATLIFSYIGFITEEVKIQNKLVVNVKMQHDISSLQETVVLGYSTKRSKKENKALMEAPMMLMMESVDYHISHDMISGPFNTEEYAIIHDNSFRETLKNPLSTFSIDVDNASYSNIRRYISWGQTPPKDAVRIEEMINYFTYNYPQPKGEDPFSVNMEVSDCPWNNEHKLVHIGLQGKNIPFENLPPSNLVFLIDVSGSMDTPERLPLVKSAFKMLVDQLRPQDHVSIVVYAGAAGLVLPPTSGDKKREILKSIEELEAGGSTAGGAGIKLAYDIAKNNFKVDGNNRVILATDGDFNVGVSSNAEMERLIEQKRETGIFLTVLGFGMGNYKDSKMEILANKGNGNYAYIDNIMEAKKVFVNEFGGTLFTIAKDVKLQVEFNPAKVKGYRLIGYENRMLNNEDFNNDKKDAGDMGSGHSVTALYEIIPVGVENSPFLRKVDKLKYQTEEKTIKPASGTNELMHVKIRYKQPDGHTSKLLEQPLYDRQVPFDKTSSNFRFSAAVASYGMLLRDSEFKGKATYIDVLAWAKNAKGADEEGYRAEFIRMVQSTELTAAK